MRDLPPIHPGEQLREEFMIPMNITAYRLAKDVGISNWKAPPRKSAIG